MLQFFYCIVTVSGNDEIDFYWLRINSFFSEENNFNKEFLSSFETTMHYIILLIIIFHSRNLFLIILKIINKT